MWQKTFETTEQCLDSELFDALNDAQAQGLITADKMAYLWAYKKEGMRWLNETPDWVDELEKDFGIRSEDDIDFNGYLYEER